jgi:hypothetical protein
MLNRVLLATAGLLVLSPFAQASLVTFTNFASWSAAATDVTDVSFASVGFEQYFGSGYANGDVTVTSPQGYLFGWGPPEAQNFGTGMYLIGAYNSGASVTENFSGENQAVGNEVGLYDASGTLDYTFTTNNGDTGSGAVDAVYGSLSFIGVVADSGDWVTSLSVVLPVQVGEGYGNIAIGGIEYGAAAASAPEPGSLALLGSGMVGLALYLRRRLGVA